MKRPVTTLLLPLPFTADSMKNAANAKNHDPRLAVLGGLTDQRQDHHSRVGRVLPVGVLPIGVGGRTVGHGRLGRIYGLARIAKGPVRIARIVVGKTGIGGFEPIRDALLGRADHIAGLGRDDIPDRHGFDGETCNRIVIAVAAVAAHINREQSCLRHPGSRSATGRPSA